jgi:hypothetical protein
MPSSNYETNPVPDPNNLNHTMNGRHDVPRAFHIKRSGMSQIPGPESQTDRILLKKAAKTPL